MLRIGQGTPPTILSSKPRSTSSSPARLAALAIGAVALGASATVLCVSLVQAADEAGAREFLQQEAQRGRQSRGAGQASPASRATSVSSDPVFYAPAPRRAAEPFFRVAGGGKLLEPAIDFNLFKPREARSGQGNRKIAANAITVAGDDLTGTNTVSGAASSERTICVRLCDGFHAPIGNLASTSDFQAHEALCRANNPGLPVKAFRVSAGAATIDGAKSADGKTYATLPMAYAYEKSGDQACRPAIPQANERRVSVLRDFTLRAGDTVVLDGQAKVFNGASQWPYYASDFRDFRSSPQLNPGQRHRIDQTIGFSQNETARRAERRLALVREASLRLPVDGNAGAGDLRMTDIGPGILRGSVGAGNERGPVRVIAPQTLGPAR